MRTGILETRLQQLKRRLLALATAGGAALSVFVALGLLLASMWLDLMVDLPPQLRRVAVFACAMAAIIMLARSIFIAARSTAPRLPQHLDRAAGAQGQIVSAVDLLRAQTPADEWSPISHGLADIAIDRADHIAGQVPPQSVLPGRMLRRPLIAAGAIIVSILCVLIVAPRLAKTQWLRFADPFGDHPPYSRISFDVEPGNTRVVYGSNLDLRVTPHGGEVEQLEVVLKPQTDAEAETLPMFPGSDGQWQATIASVTAPGKYFIRARGARTEKFDLGVITVPKIGEVNFKITPPSYTHRAAYEGALPQGGIAGLPGTKVQIWIKSNRPLSGGAAKIISGNPSATADAQLAPTNPGGDEVTGSFTITSAGMLSATVTDTSGQRATDAFTAPITVLPDERPFVRILEPKALSFATPDVTIPVSMLAEDDYGVARLQLYRGLNDLRARPEEMTVPRPEPVRLNATSELSLSQYGLKPGDMVKLYARVEDNDPAGAKGSESPISVIRIVSAEQMQRMQLEREGMEVLQSKYEQASRRLEALDKQIEQLLKDLEKLDPNSELAKEKKDEIAKLAEQMEKEAAAVEKSAQENLPFDIDKKFRKELDKVAKNMREAAEQAKATSKKPGLSIGGAQADLKDIQKKLGTCKGGFDQDVIAPLEHLAKIYPLKEDEARFIELYQQQRELEQRIQSLRGNEANKDDPTTKARLRDLEEEQQAIHQDLRNLLADIDNHVAQLPEDERLNDLRQTATTFAKAVRESAADEQMALAESSLSDFNGTAAHDAAKNAADTLEKFIGHCKGMGGEASMCLKFSPGLSEGLGNTVEQLLESMGMGSKPGMGMGNGGGYSARRSTLNNVGLYGHFPTRSSSANGRGGNRPGVSTDGSGNPNEDPSLANVPGGRENMTGEGAANVPPQYRKRVGEYFRRVADELGTGEQKR